MKGKQNGLVLGVLAFLVLSLAVASPMWAQGRGPGPMGRGNGQGPQAAPGALAMLNRALNQAGADALTTAQVNGLKALVNTFRTNLPKPGQDTTLADARTAYDNAILAGDSAGVTAAATTIATENSKFEYARLVAVGQSEISALAILTPAQVTALKAKLGSDGLIRVLESLFGGPAMVNGRGAGLGVRGSAVAPMIKR